MNTLVALYHLMRVEDKLPDEGARIMYLKDIWGMEQKRIGECIGKSQSYVSNVLRKARHSMSDQHFKALITNMWSAEEIKKIQFLPRNIIGDIAVMAFITHILDVYVSHPFFQYHNVNDTFRIRALASLGVQQKRLLEIFDKSQPSMSMLIKRGVDVDLSKFDKVGRYDETSEYKLTNKPVAQKFVQANMFSW